MQNVPRRAPAAPTPSFGVRHAGLRQIGPRQHDHAMFETARRAALIALMVGLHGALGWSLLQWRDVREAVVEAAPIFVDWIDPRVAVVAPSLTQVPPPQRRTLPVAPTPPALPLSTTTPTPQTVPVVVAPAVDPALVPDLPVPSAVQADSTAPLALPVTTPAVPQPAQPTPPASPKILPGSAVQYLEPPVLAYPRASRRAGESGRVMVRVLVDEAGMPQQVQISQSSGFARLDDAARAAVHKARFKPYLEGGRAMAGWAFIPLIFDLEN